MHSYTKQPQVYFKKRSRFGNKYGNKVIHTPEGKFDSKMEYTRFKELQILERIGDITSLQRQVAFVLTAHGVDICKYVADFVYYQNGLKVVEDVKGVQTPEFKLKAKLFQAQHGFGIYLTGGK